MLSSLVSFSISIFGLLIISSCKNVYGQDLDLGSSCVNPIKDKAYAAKVNSVLSSLSSYASGSAKKYKFYKSTAGIGSGHDVVYGLYLCRGDVNKSDCKTCVQSASKLILEQCPNYKTAINWHDNCFLRYSNQRDFPDRRLQQYFDQYPADPKRYSQYLVKLLNVLATTTSGKKFAVKEGNFTALNKVFSLAQCLPDISRTDCDVCLRSAISDIQTFCIGCLGARVHTPVCNIRFENFSFYNDVKPGASLDGIFPKRPLYGPIKKVMLPP